MTKEEFLAKARQVAKESSAKSGLPPGVTVAQAVLESRWGESELSRRAHNYFGIKAHGKHAWVEMPTTEVEGGEEKHVGAKFAQYASMEQCFECRDALIANGALYVEARRVADDPQRFIRELSKRWATDPHYAEKLLRVYEELGLVKMDEQKSVGTQALRG